MLTNLPRAYTRIARVAVTRSTDARVATVDVHSRTALSLLDLQGRVVHQAGAGQHRAVEVLAKVVAAATKLLQELAGRKR